MAEVTDRILIDPATLRATRVARAPARRAQQPSAALAAWAAGRSCSRATTATRERRRSARVRAARSGDAEWLSFKRPPKRSIARIIRWSACCSRSSTVRSRAENDYAAQFAQKRGKEAAIEALAPWFHLPRAVRRADEARSSGRRRRAFVDVAFGKLFSPFEKDTYVVPKLDGTQAVRVAKAMIATQAAPPEHPRAQRGGASALSLQSRRCRELPHRRAHRVRRALRGRARPGRRGARSTARPRTTSSRMSSRTSTPRSATSRRRRRAPRSLERLFAERRSYWRMGSAIGDIWNPALHAEIMATARRTSRCARRRLLRVSRCASSSSRGRRSSS